jgi:exopolysaccharide biosynthesis polyprenyl glycosylphosphotransferase
MCTTNRNLHTSIQLLLDCLSLKLIWDCTIHVRILLNPFLHARVSGEQSALWAPPAALILSLWLVSSLILRLYRPPSEINARTLTVWAFENAVAVTTLTAVTTFFSREFGELVSRMFVPAVFPVAWIVFAVTRYMTTWLLPRIERRWPRPLRIALVGDWRKANHVFRNLGAQRNAICGLIVPEDAFRHAVACPLPVLGTTRQMAELINRERLDRAVVLDAALTTLELEHCTAVCDSMGVPVSCALDIAPERVLVDLTTHYGIPLVDMVPRHFTRGQGLIKRLFDVAVSATALMALAPLLIVIAVLIKLTSKGPVLYKSLRVGKGGRHFTFLKFRSMYVNDGRSTLHVANEKGGHIFKMRADPRVTPVGRFLRRYSLDELPQLINVVRGEMSIVGPRPLPACDLGPDGMSEQYALWSEGRARVHPGLTGLWQVSGRSDLSFEDMVRLDLSYIQNWSLGLDIRIIVDTPMLVLRGVGAY